jgi:hypothetical protein
MSTPAAAAQTVGTEVEIKTADGTRIYFWRSAALVLSFLRGHQKFVS